MQIIFDNPGGVAHKFHTGAFFIIYRHEKPQFKDCGFFYGSRCTRQISYFKMTVFTKKNNLKKVAFWWTLTDSKNSEERKRNFRKRSVSAQRFGAKPVQRS